MSPFAESDDIEALDAASLVCLLEIAERKLCRIAQVIGEKASPDSWAARRAKKLREVLYP